MTNEHELPVLQIQRPNQAPRAVVLAGSVGHRPITVAAAKRQRFIQNLQANYQRLKEALEFVEHFAVVCEVSQGRIAGIRQSKDVALNELSDSFAAKLKAYDSRIGGSPS